MHDNAQTRYHALDALRAAMMLLGLVLHSAASYTRTPLDDAWPYQDPQTSVAFDLLIFFIHLFRMPVFFVIAGFFAALLYVRDGPARFLRNRTRRVLLPLVLFWPLVPLAGLGFVFAVSRTGGSVPFVGRGGVLFAPVLGHLWFLYDLVIFYAAAVLTVPMVERLPVGVRRRALAAVRSAVSTPPGAIALGLVTTATMIPMKVPGLETSVALLPPLRVLIAYGVFFAFGWLLYGARDVIPSFAVRWHVPFAAGIAASVAYLYVAVAQPFTSRTAFHLTEVTFAGLSIWLLIFGTTGLFVRCLDRPRPVVRYLSDASYWMYLVHIVPVIWLPALLATVNIPAALKFAAVLSGTTLLTITTYDLFVRSTAIGQLLNGRLRRSLIPSP